MSATDFPRQADCQAELAPWRSPLSRALHRNRAVPFSRYLQLATVRADRSPANRTVVFRGFLAQTNRLMFISDRRSEKTAQIQQTPDAEACWYFTKTREQFRLSGEATVITAETNQSDLAEARAQTWQKISDNARLQFAWPDPKGDRADKDAFSPKPLDDQVPPDTFTLLLLAPISVDHLELRGEPQSRHLYQKLKEGPWETTVVNP